jgi:hypothetical protein
MLLATTKTRSRCESDSNKATLILSVAFHRASLMGFFPLVLKGLITTDISETDISVEYKIMGQVAKHFETDSIIVGVK